MASLGWRPALELTAARELRAGSAEELAAAIAAGADLRIHTEFVHNEHIDLDSQSDELVTEVSDFPVTYLIGGEWSAGIMTLRQPVSLSHEGFGRPSMSFFLYNQDGAQAIARPYLDGGGPQPPADHSAMGKYHQASAFDEDTTAPSSNFVYEFGQYRFLVRERWSEALHTTSDGAVISGSMEELGRAVTAGSPIKVGVRGLLDDLGGEADAELFVELGPCYFYTRQGLMVGESRPVVRVAPAIPLAYGSGNWDFGWLIVRSDGQCDYLRYDPASLVPESRRIQLEVRWFVESDSRVSPSENEV